MKKCLVIGAVMLDIVMQIDELPKTGEDIYAYSQEMKIGGCAYNVADILKHFQVPYTLFAPIGTGVYAEIISQKLNETKQESFIHSAAQDNGYCLCMVEKTGERTFLTLPGIECRFDKKWFDEVNAEEYNAVYICGYELEGEGGETIIEFLENNRSLTIYYAPGPRINYISEEKQKRIFSLQPITHLNEKEAIDYTGKSTYENAAKKLWEQSGNAVIITLGEKGSYYYHDKTTVIIPAETTDVLDTIGAGDSNIGAFIAMRQLGNDFQQSIETANRVSALVVAVQGPTLTEDEFKKGGFSL